MNNIGDNPILYNKLDGEVWAIIEDNTTDFVSGGATGVDSMTKKWCERLGRKFVECAPTHNHWSCSPSCYGFRARNVVVANKADTVYCVTWSMPKQTCYHCYAILGGKDPHKVSGGCWTLRYAEKIGKDIQLVIV